MEVRKEFERGVGLSFKLNGYEGEFVLALVTTTSPWGTRIDYSFVNGNLCISSVYCGGSTGFGAKEYDIKTLKDAEVEVIYYLK